MQIKREDNNENRISGNTINWYPGHMAKAKREIAAALPLVDIVLELIDSRLPSSSQNPDFLTLFANKPTLTLLTKTSLCDRTKLPEWKRRLEESGRRVIAIDCRQNRDLSPVTAEIREILHEKLERAAAKGIKNQAIRCLVVGITNVGKSTFINTYTNSKKAKVEDRPGVTRQNQWVTASGGIELLDTPGLLWHKFDVQLVGVKLAAIGSIRDEILDTLTLSCRLLGLIMEKYPECLETRYKIKIEDSEPYDVFEKIGRARGFMQSGGVINEDRTAACILDEFRSGAIGKMTLD